MRKKTASRGHPDIIHSGGGDMVLLQHAGRGVGWVCGYVGVWGSGSVSLAPTRWGMTQAGARTVTVMGQVFRVVVVGGRGVRAGGKREEVEG